MAEFKFEIVKNFGTISNNNGWVKEVNLISWNNREPIYDIRSWQEGHEQMGKGITLTSEELKSQRRSRNMALARQTAMFLIRKLTNLSLKDIGNFFDGRDHTTVLTSIKRIEDKTKNEPQFNQTIKDITANINSHK